MKNILVISSFWTGIRSFFLKGDTEFKGMPAFTNTFFKLLNSNDVDKVYVLFFGKNIKTEFNFPDKYNQKLEVIGFNYVDKLSACSSLFNLLLISFKIIIKNKIHIIYGHGSISGIAGVISFLTKVPNVRRIYGTFLSEELALPNFKIFINHPLEYLAFSLPAVAIICTNDGTKGDKVFEKIGNNSTPFYFWLNGIDKIRQYTKYSVVDKKYNINFTPHICYIARIDIWKRQHLLIKSLIDLSNRGKIFKTIIAGPIVDENYYDELHDLIFKNGLQNSIKLIPGLTKEESISVIKESSISVSFYDLSNLGNVFLESLSVGTVMLTENINNSLDLIDRELYYNVNPVDSKKTAIEIAKIFDNLNDIKQKSKLSSDFADKTLLTWSERSQKELDLLGLNVL